MSNPRDAWSEPLDTVLPVAALGGGGPSPRRGRRRGSTSDLTTIVDVKGLYEGLLSARHGMLVIVNADDIIVGDVSYHQTAYGPNSASYAYNIGITVAPEHRGQGYGVEAQRLLAAYLFATYPVMRVEAQTDITNVPEQRALEKAGFTREGVIRQAQWRNGAWHDLVLYSKVRGE